MNTKHQSNKIKYIAGLKGIACVMTMLGHYFAIYTSSQFFLPRIGILDKLVNSRFYFIINASYWMYLFFVISGYLVGRSQIKDIKTLFTKTILRFVRFFIPILFSCGVILAIHYLVGFHNFKTIDILGSAWFQDFYNNSFNLIELIKSPFEVLIFGRSSFNSPYWMIRDIMIASIITYFLRYIIFRFSKNDVLCFVIIIGTLLISYFINKTITACFIGTILAIYENKLFQLIKTSYFALFIMFAAMSLYFIPSELVASCFFAVAILFIPRVKIIDNILSSKILQGLGNISWGIYSFHWPVICSIGSLLIINTYESIGIINAYFFTFAVSFIIILIISVAYFFSFEKLSSKLTHFFILCLKKL